MSTEWEQGKDGKWRLYEYQSSRQVMQWYHEGAGKRSLFRDPDGKPLVFATKEAGIEYVRRQRWGAAL